MNLITVSSSLTGLIRTHNGLILLQPINTIVSSNNDRNSKKVKLICGGGSGHEPAHAGYVGHGMLTAAICGEIFASPPVSSILQTILNVGNADCNILLIVKNYTGDRLNFGLATEIAFTKYGYKNIKILLVDDDCSIDDTFIRKSVGKRGLAGVVLMHKLLGAMADTGCTLDHIYNFGKNILENNQLCTIGFTFNTNGGNLQDIEIGKGIHGEPGIFKIDSLDSFKQIFDIICVKIQKKIKEKSQIILLINNLGGTAEFLLNSFCNDLINIMQNLYEIERVYYGTFLSSLKQEGISVTVFGLEGHRNECIEYLNYEVNVPSKLFTTSTSKSSTISSIEIPRNYIETNEDVNLMAKRNGELGIKLTSTVIEFTCEALMSCKEMLNLMDSECGDGDTGTTMAKGAEAILEAMKLQNISLQYPALLLQEISSVLQLKMGGTSGALYSIFFQSASKAFLGNDNSTSVTIDTWLNSLKFGISAVMRYALTEINDRTMLDPLYSGSNKLEESLKNNVSVLDAIESFTTACEEATKDTINTIPKAGRASYSCSEKVSTIFKHPDAGAQAVAIWARGLFEACKFYFTDDK